MFHMDWSAAQDALPEESVSHSEQTSAFVRELCPGLKNKLERHFLAQGVSQPIIEQ